MLSFLERIGVVVCRPQMNIFCLTHVWLEGYVEQFHVLPPRATVREALSFAVNMKLPTRLSFAEKDEAIERAVRLLQLEPIVNAIIGSPDLGTYVSCTSGGVEGNNDDVRV